MRGIVKCPRIAYTDLNSLWLMAEWHEVRQSPGSLVWNGTDVWTRQASPVCMGGNAPITEEVTRWFRTSRLFCNA
jgi:hypothetical protein